MHWIQLGVTQQVVFKEIMYQVVTTQVLALPNSEQTLEMDKDASQHAMHVIFIIYRVLKSVTYHSETFLGEIMNY